MKAAMGRSCPGPARAPAPATAAHCSPVLSALTLAPCLDAAATGSLNRAQPRRGPSSILTSLRNERAARATTKAPTMKTSEKMATPR